MTDIPPPANVPSDRRSSWRSPNQAPNWVWALVLLAGGGGLGGIGSMFARPGPEARTSPKVESALVKLTLIVEQHDRELNRQDARLEKAQARIRDLELKASRRAP